MIILQPNTPTYHASDGKDILNGTSESDMFTTKHDAQWYKTWADMYISAFSKHDGREMKNYKKYRGIRDDKEFAKKLGSPTDYEMPIPDVPHVPLIRPYIDSLVSINQVRPFVYNIKYNDVDAVKEKDKLLAEEVATKVIEEFQNALKSKPAQDEQGLQKQQQELQERIEKITSQIPNFRTVQERVAQKVLDLCVERLNIRQKSATAILDQFIVGKEYYRCKLERVGELPMVEIVNPNDISFGAEQVDNLNQCEFVVHRKYLSIHDIYSMYGHEFTEADKATLKIYENTFVSNRDNRDSLQSNYYPIIDNEYGYMGSLQGNLIEVYEVEWKVNKKIPVTELEGKYQILEDDDILEDGIDERKVKYKYLQELHTCIRIGHSIYVRKGKVKHARRDNNDISKVLLTYNGKIYNDRNNPPLSLVNELSDLQDRYDIIWYKLIEMVMLSGNKGAVLIEELLPPDMKPEEWLFWRKLGIARFSISNEGIDPNLVNQIGQALQVYDDTLSANGVESALALIRQIDKTVSDITGVSPQMRGQIAEYETKAGAELSVTQGSITTEKIHQFHSEFMKELLNDILYWAKIGLSKGDLRDYVLTKGEQELTKDLDWSWIDYNVLIVDGYKEEKALQEAKMMIQELVKAQAVGYDVLIKSKMSGSLNELDDIVTKSMLKVQERMEKQSQVEQQTKAQELQAKMQMEQAKLQSQMEEAKMKLQQDQQKLVEEVKMKNQEVSIKDRLASVEEGYLEVAKKELDAGIETANKKLDAREGRNKN